MRKVTLITIFLSILTIINAQVNETNTFEADSVQKKELKMTQKLTEMVVTQLKNTPVEKFYRYGIKNKEQLENLQLGRAIREYTIKNDTLFPLGWQVLVLSEGKPVFLAKVSAREVRFGPPMMGESIHHYERDDLMGILMDRTLPSGVFHYIRRENKDVFIQVFDPATRKYFKNEYSFSEIINLTNRALEVRAAPTKEGMQEIYGTNAPVDEKDVFDTNFPQKHELKMTHQITEMLISELYWDLKNEPDWELSNFGITNRYQLENLHFGKPIPEYRIDIKNENLIFTGTWHVSVMSNGEPLFITRVSEGDCEYRSTGGGGADWAKILHNYEYKDLIIGYLALYPSISYYVIRKDHKDIFVEEYNYATREYFKNEYSFGELINLLKK